ncbi:MAG: TonB-dependent receptor [Candidatus Kryptoniota bacterium]
MKLPLTTIINYKETKHATRLKLRQIEILLAVLLYLMLPTYDDCLGVEPNRTGTLNGRVINASNGEPICGAAVLVEKTALRTSTSKDGYYIIRSIPSGKYTVAVSMLGYKSEKKVVSFKDGETLNLDFSLEETAFEMTGVLVTGTSTPHIYEDIPVRTELISRKAIEQRHALNLADALSSQTGLRVETECQNCNFTQVRILGMDGRYSQILIDGDPTVSSLASVYGLEQIPEEMIDHIEVVKGGGSSIYGPGAVAGVINVVTRMPYVNRVKVRYNGQWLDEHIPDQEVGLTVERANDKATEGAFVFASARGRLPYDQNGDGYSELVRLRNETIGATWYDEPFENAKLIVHFHRIHEDRRGGNNFDAPPNFANIAEWLEHWRWGGSVQWSQQIAPQLDYKTYYSFGLTERKSYFGGLKGTTEQDTLQALKYYGATRDNLYATGAQVNFRSGNHEVTAGAQYLSEMLIDKATANPTYFINQTYRDVGIFLQDNYSMRRNITLLAGTRLDKHSEINKWILSPRISGLIKLNSILALRMSLSTGFMPPQIYNEDLHLCGVSGDQRVTRNAPDLKPETDLTASISLDYNSFFSPFPIFLSVTGFSTSLKDAFGEKFVSKLGNIELWYRINSGGAMINGIELDASLNPCPRIHVAGGITYQTSLYDQPLPDFDTRHFLKTPDLYGHAEFTTQLTDNITFNVGAIYTGEMYLSHEVTTDPQSAPQLRLENVPGFLQLDMGIDYHIVLGESTNSKLQVGVKNLTNAFQRDLDRGINRDPNYFYGPGIPRTIYAGIEVGM